MIVDNFKAKNFGARELDPSSVADQIDNAIAKLGASAFSGVEGPNEYNATLKKAGNTDWAQDLRAFATATHQAVRNNPAASALPVVAPSLAWNDKANFQELGDLSSVSDLGNLHAYSGERPLDTALGQLLQLVSIVNPGQPVLVTEYGLQTAMKKWQAHPFTDKVKAKYLARSMAALFARPEVKRGFIYQLIDTNPNSELDNPDEHFGLLRNDGSPTKAYHAVRNIMHLLCDADSGFNPRALKASLSGDLQNVREFLAAEGLGRFLPGALARRGQLREAEAEQLAAFPGMERRRAAGDVSPSKSRSPRSARICRARSRATPMGARGLRTPSTRRPRVSLDAPDELLIVEIVPEGASNPESPSGCNFTPSIR